MTAEQDDLSPDAVKAAHQPEHDGWDGWVCAECEQSSRKGCEPYRLAQALSQAQSELERIAGHTRDAYDQRDAAQEALAASEAKVARVEASLVETRRRLLDTAWSSDQEDRVRVAVLHLEAAMEGRANPLADPTPTAPCPRTTPFKSYTEPTCSRPEGHAGGCLFNSHDGRTPLEVMPK